MTVDSCCSKIVLLERRPKTMYVVPYPDIYLCMYVYI